MTPTIYLATGQEVIRLCVDEIIGLLLPEYYWKEDEGQVTPLDSSEDRPVSNLNAPNSRSNLETQPVPPAQMLGPSYALYALSRNGKSSWVYYIHVIPTIPCLESLRDEIRTSKRYVTLKGRYLSGSLVSGPDPPPWRVKTPNRSKRALETISPSY